MTLSLYGPSEDSKRVAYRATDDYNSFLPELEWVTSVRDSLAQLVEFMKSIYLETGSELLYALASYEEESEETVWDRDDIRNGVIASIPWAFILPTDSVDAIGPAVVLDTPAAVVEELSNGAILVVTHENPLETDWNAHNRVKAHLMGDGFPN